MLARRQTNRRGKLFCDKERSSVLFSRSIRRAKGRCRSRLMLYAPAAAACCPSLKPCCKKQFWRIAREAKTSSSWNATSQIQQCRLTRGPVHPEVICLMPFAFLSFYYSIKCNPATFILSGQWEKATHSMLWMQHELLISVVKSNVALLKEFGFVLFSGCVLWLPPQPTIATGLAVVVFSQAQVRDSLLHPKLVIPR